MHEVREKLANVGRQLGREEKGRKGEFHGGRARWRHGRWRRGARMRYLGSTDDTIASTKCWRARRSCWPRWRRGGEFARRLRWRSVASWLRAGGEASTGEQESGRDGVEMSAARSAGVGGRVGVAAGRLRRAAASTAHGRHAAGKLCHGRARGAARQRAGAWRQAKRGAALGWAERGEARAGGWLGRLWPRARSEAATREGEKAFFICIFKEFF